MASSTISRFREMADEVFEITAKQYEETYTKLIGDEPLAKLRLHGYYAFRHPDNQTAVLLVAAPGFDD